ncbi:putative membrane protein [Bacillus phage SP-15]|uniref:Putative membrane protein n=1 Tax=Bacillus phage SP-15 TaxID=1792032 RepID=A0A127AWX0_9CAUD|nr:hypothetical protein SP15_239A [Bacillus phage SP-15]AMM45043.1 putative membrane protein [Bacillus phage SP-15]
MWVTIWGVIFVFIVLTVLGLFITKNIKYALAYGIVLTLAVVGLSLLGSLSE